MPAASVDALHARLAGRGRYLTGPAARYTLSGQWLSPVARQAADEAGLGAECRNPYRSILVRAVEVVYAVDEALRLIGRYEPPAPCRVDAPPRAAIGHGATEAPRGVLFHRYAIDAEGLITSARIVPPTSQNQASIEDDLRRFVAGRLDLDDQQLTYTHTAWDYRAEAPEGCASCGGGDGRTAGGQGQCPDGAVGGQMVSLG